MKTSRGTKLDTPRCLEFPFRGTFYHSELEDLFSTRVCANRWFRRSKGSVRSETREKIIPYYRK